MVMSKQQMLDKAVKGLASQGFVQSRGPGITENPGRCAYRGNEGRRCAIGWLIPDDKYYPELEKNGEGHKLPKSVLNFRPSSMSLVWRLQLAHDRAINPDQMKQNLKDLAKEFGLRIPKELK